MPLLPVHRYPLPLKVRESMYFVPTSILIAGYLGVKDPDLELPTENTGDGDGPAPAKRGRGRPRKGTEVVHNPADGKGAFHSQVPLCKLQQTCPFCEKKGFLGQ